jgi:hypothetical protein
MADQDQASTEPAPDRVPAGDQTPRNPGAAPAQEMGGGVGLALPGDPARKEEQAGPEGHRP